MGQEISERSLDNVRLEWVAESTVATAPSNPSWNRFGDYIRSAPGYSPEANVSAPDASLGSSDVDEHFRGPRSGTLNLSWWMQRAPIDSSDNANDPIGEILNRSNNSILNTHTVVFRRDQSNASIGNDSAGVRAYTVGRGCYPSQGVIPGDPSASEPMVAEATYQCAVVETHLIHQPSAGTTVDVVSDDAGDTTQTLTIEDEDAGTTEDVSLNGTTTVTTVASFSGIDAAYLDGETAGDVTITDGAGTTLMTITGSNTDGVDGERGVPALGTGSHASAIGTAPEDYLFLGTSTTWNTHTAADRIHALDLTVEIGMTTEAQQDTRQMAIDPGVRTASVDADTAGPFESSTRYSEYMRGVEGDIVFNLPDGDTITLKNAQCTSVDDQDYSAGDANNVFSTTFAGHVGDDSNAVEANTTA